MGRVSQRSDCALQIYVASSPPLRITLNLSELFELFELFELLDLTSLTHLWSPPADGLLIRKRRRGRDAAVGPC